MELADINIESIAARIADDAQLLFVLRNVELRNRKRSYMALKPHLTFKPMPYWYLSLRMN